MCSKIVIGVSILMGLMAVIVAIFGLMQMGKIPVSDQQKSVFRIQGVNDAGIGAGNIAIGIVGLLVACLGCLTGVKKAVCFAIPYGLLSFIISIIFLIITIFAFGVSS